MEISLSLYRVVCLCRALSLSAHVLCASRRGAPCVRLRGGWPHDGANLALVHTLRGHIHRAQLFQLELTNPVCIRPAHTHTHSVVSPGLVGLPAHLYRTGTRSLIAAHPLSLSVRAWVVAYVERLAASMSLLKCLHTAGHICSFHARKSSSRLLSATRPPTQHTHTHTHTHKHTRTHTHRDTQTPSEPHRSTHHTVCSPNKVDARLMARPLTLLHMHVLAIIVAEAHIIDTVGAKLS
jgi:hypothetical protein